VRSDCRPEPSGILTPCTLRATLLLAQHTTVDTRLRITAPATNCAVRPSCFRGIARVRFRARYSRLRITKAERTIRSTNAVARRHHSCADLYRRWGLSVLDDCNCGSAAPVTHVRFVGMLAMDDNGDPMFRGLHSNNPGVKYPRQQRSRRFTCDSDA
jgi:hypothetical protein